MKTTLSTSEAVNRLMSDDNANWSRAGARALVEHLEDLESSEGTELELDTVALRCDYSEWDTALEAAIKYGYEPDPALGEDSQDDDDKELDALDWLADQTVVIKFPAGIIVAKF
jgi:hypothetical protein